MENLDLREGYGSSYDEFNSSERRPYSSEYQNREEVYSRVVRAGKRTYFFDVKSTRNGELFLNITESRKRFNKDNEPHYEKHTVFLYKEGVRHFSLLDLSSGVCMISY
ncbi:MAG: DUF3276 family protein [Bacteroidota bacterium]